MRGEKGDGNSVYYDKIEEEVKELVLSIIGNLHKGTWKCRHCNWTHQNGSPSIVDIESHEGYFHKAMNTKTLNQWGPCFGLETKGAESIDETYEMQSEITKTLTMEVSHQTVRNVEDQKGFGLSPAPVEHLHEEANGSFKHFEKEAKVDANVDLTGEIKEDLYCPNGSFKHIEEETKDANIDLIGEIEEDLMDLDVEGVLEKQTTHDLYCPNCNSCITKRVILVRKKPKVSIRPKPKRGKKPDLIPTSAGFVVSGDTPEIHSDPSPAAAPDEQDASREQEQKQEQEAFSCLSCFSLFIPIGNGCFKIFQFFRVGRQTEHTQSPQEIRQREHSESTQGTNLSENNLSPQGTNLSENTQSPSEINSEGKTQSPQEISPEGKTQSPQGISQNEYPATPQLISGNDDTQSPQKRSHDANMSSPQCINNNEDAQKPQDISWNGGTQSPQKRNRDANMSNPQHINPNEDAQKARDINRNEDTQSPPKISRNENAQNPQDVNQNDSKQRPQKIPTEKTNWILSIFGYYKSKGADHAVSVQSAAVPTPSVINGEHIDATAIKLKEPGISDIFSSTDSSLLGKLKGESTVQKPDTDLFQRNIVSNFLHLLPLQYEAGDNDIKDIETGLLEPLLRPSVEVPPSSQTITETEYRGTDAGEVREWEILKSIVYGGLIESITSLGIVSSAAGAGADTLNVLALGVANLIGGLIIICHNLRELKNDQPRASNIEEDRYQVLLGRRQNFKLHAFVAILSFLIFGLVPPVVYGFSFRISDDKDLKLAAMAGASLICIILLALGKGHVRKPNRAYFRTVFYYLSLGITASGISYVVGQLLKKLAEQLGLFDSSSTVSMPFLETIPMEVGRASY
ncbi:membrane protein of ER body-like protein isoform X1 [Gossypium australe]|uniref:Membrane protein of ER body-like protein isoform X1 n=1 Tax=Gossypium australe TaxID=47621 RepID=A0A5B6URY9_9ROSI|nr:membrane protein of ER body-like protein isoform X1 [Gossypium australe]